MKLRTQITSWVTKWAVVDLGKGKTESFHQTQVAPLSCFIASFTWGATESTYLSSYSFLKTFEASYHSWKIKRSSFRVIESAVDQESKITGLNLEPLDFCVISDRSLCLRVYFPEDLPIYSSLFWEAVTFRLINLFKHWIQSKDSDENISLTHLINILRSYHVPGTVPDIALDLVSFPILCSKENLW